MTPEEAEDRAAKGNLPEKNRNELLTQLQNYKKELRWGQLQEIDIVGKYNQKLGKVLDKLIMALEEISLKITQYEAVRGACCDSSKT